MARRRGNRGTICRGDANVYNVVNILDFSLLYFELWPDGPTEVSGE
jgi:hypothetical protein